MQHLEVSGVVRPIYGSLGVRRLTDTGNVLIGYSVIASFSVVELHISEQKLRMVVVMRLKVQGVVLSFMSVLLC